MDTHDTLGIGDVLQELLGHACDESFSQSVGVVGSNTAVEADKILIRHDLVDTFTHNGVRVGVSKGELGAAFSDGGGAGGVVGTVIEETGIDFDLGSSAVLGDQHTLGQTFGFADGGHEVQITGVPFGVEVPVGSTVPAVVLHTAGEEGAPVAAGKSSGGKEIHAFVVLPALEVHADTVVVLGIDLKDSVRDFDLGDGTVIFGQKFAHFTPAPFGSLDQQSVQLRINEDA